jgi:hypothetical protein
MAKFTMSEAQNKNTAPEANNEATIKPNSYIDFKLNLESGLIVDLDGE